MAEKHGIEFVETDQPRERASKLNRIIRWLTISPQVDTLRVGATGKWDNDGDITCTDLTASGDATVAGTLGVTGATTLSGGAAVTGNITVTGTVDGRDVATDGTKLDGVEASADVTDATNVAAAGAVMESDYFNIVFLIDGGGSAISTGIAGWVMVPHDFTITGCWLLADQSGAIKVDIWADSYTNYPPDNTDTITGGNEPEIAASGVKDEDTTLTDWTTDMSAGDILYYNVDSCTTIEKCLVVLRCTRE
jgi:hypothetical protein